VYARHIFIEAIAYAAAIDTCRYASAAATPPSLISLDTPVEMIADTVIERLRCHATPFRCWHLRWLSAATPAPATMVRHGVYWYAIRLPFPRPFHFNRCCHMADIATVTPLDEIHTAYMFRFTLPRLLILPLSCHYAIFIDAFSLLITDTLLPIFISHYATAITDRYWYDDITFIAIADITILFTLVLMLMMLTLHNTSYLLSRLSPITSHWCLRHIADINIYWLRHDIELMPL